MPPPGNFKVEPGLAVERAAGRPGLPSYGPAGGSHLVTKVGIDATRKSNYPEEIRVPGADDINLADCIEGYRAG